MLPVRSIFIFAYLIIASCKRPVCNNEDPVFDEHRPEEQVYKQELARKIRSASEEDLRFWYVSAANRDGRELLIADVQGPGICAKAELVVNDWSGIEQLRGAAPNGYRGAELKRLRYSIAEDSGHVDFIYEGLDRIVD